MRTKRVAAGPGQTERRGRDDELTDTCLQSHNVLLFVSVCAIILRVLPAVSVPSLSMSACFKATAERTTLNKKSETLTHKHALPTGEAEAAPNKHVSLSLQRLFVQVSKNRTHEIAVSIPPSLTSSFTF